MEKKIYFVSSLPRSGSTLFMNILGQNPNHYVTPTSGLIEIFSNVLKTWKNTFEFNTEGLNKVKPRMKGLLKGMIHGFFENEFEQNKVVFDKSRAWPTYLEQIEDCLGHEIKIIATVRDPRAIASSFEKLYRSREIDWNYPENTDLFIQEQTVVGRAQNYFSQGGVIGIAINRLRDLIIRKPDRLIVIPYNLLVKHPEEVMEDVTKSLGLKEFEYNFKNIRQITNEDDTLHGMKLHKIRNKIEPIVDDWEKILPKKVSDDILNQYKDIVELSLSNSIFAEQKDE
jgi:sulfotransferase